MEIQKHTRHIVRFKLVHHVEVYIVVQYLQILNHGSVGNIPRRKSSNTVKNRQRIAQGPVCLLRNHVKRFWLRYDPLFGGHKRQMFCDIFNTNAFEIKYLATR